MTDHQLRDLLSDAVDDVEPGYALDTIRARTKPAKARWPYAAGVSILAIAASITAFAVLGNGAQPHAVDPATTTSAAPSPSPSLSPSPSVSPAPTDPSPSMSATEVPSQTVPVYYIGNTPDGPRLYREVRTVAASNPFDAAVAALEQRPLDPDYVTSWPAGAIEGISFDGIGAQGLIQVRLSDNSLHDRPPGMDGATAQMAIQQVIYTLQDGVRSPVQFFVGGNPVDQVYGVPTSEPLANGPVLDTLALVSLTVPMEGMQVDNDVPLRVEGLGNSFEGTIVVRVLRPNGTEVGTTQSATAGWIGDKLFPFSLELDLRDLAPGHYVIAAQTDDPSGAGMFHEDNRYITVTD